jgi:hypothetical protein
MKRLSPSQARLATGNRGWSNWPYEKARLGSGEVSLALHASEAGDPSLRLMNGCSQDDSVLLKNELHHQRPVHNIAGTGQRH